MAIANSSGPVWQGVGVTSGGVTTNGGLAFPASNQNLVYDQDGNLTFDGIWSYFWDCENRLTAMQMTNISGVADSNRLQLQFAYDYQGKRVRKTAQTWSSSSQTFGSPVTTPFVYDGWNLVAELTTQWAVTQAFVLGKDLSGTMQGAGGIGGLLGAVQIANAQVSNCGFTCYDGNGNITALISGNDQSLLTRYEYSPFGELLRATGPVARGNPFRSSTKFRDDESSLVYYGYRYYSPTLGRWISRDPLKEKGGLHLYAFVRNHPTAKVDKNGREEFEWSDFFETVGEDLLDTLPDVAESFGEEGLSYLGSVGDLVSGTIADLSINPTSGGVLEMDASLMSAEFLTQQVMNNVQRSLVNRLTGANAASFAIGVGVGVVAKAVDRAGGNGDDVVLDAALSAAGTLGVDASENIWGVATTVQDY